MDDSTSIPIPLFEGYVQDYDDKASMRNDLAGRSGAFSRWAPKTPPEIDGSYHLTHDGTFDFLGSLVYVLGKFENPPNLYLASWWWNREAVWKVLKLFDAGRIKSLNFVLCQSFEYRDIDLHRWITGELAKRGQRHKTWINHAKVFVFENDDDAYLVETSGNFSNNRQMEQIGIHRSRVAADFYKAWMLRGTGLLNQAKGQNKKAKKRSFQSIPMDENSLRSDVFMGRFQPLHNGHLGVIRKMENPIIVIVAGETTSKDRDKNPLSFTYRKSLILEVVPNAMVIKSKTGHLPEVLMSIRNKQREPGILYAGIDRLQSYKAELKVFNSRVKRHHAFKVRFVETYSEAHRTSATQVRKAIRGRHRKLFETLTPKELWPFYDDLRRRMG